jgi:hypothetical protein
MTTAHHGPALSWIRQGIESLFRTLNDRLRSSPNSSPSPARIGEAVGVEQNAARGV